MSTRWQHAENTGPAEEGAGAVPEPVEGMAQPAAAAAVGENLYLVFDCPSGKLVACSVSDLPRTLRQHPRALAKTRWTDPDIQHCAAASCDPAPPPRADLTSSPDTFVGRSPKGFYAPLSGKCALQALEAGWLVGKILQIY